MKVKLQSFAVSVLLVVFGLGFFVLQAGLKHGNSIVTIIGLVMFVGVGVFGGTYFISMRSKRRKTEKENRRELEVFKQKAKIINVNLEEVEIITNKWTDTIVVNNTQYGGLNELAGFHDANIRKIDRNLNSVRITIPINREKMEYLLNIEMDPTTLSMHFAIKKETQLYIHGDELYLDLEFLE